MPLYNINSEANISLAANTAKTVATVTAPSTRKEQIVDIAIGFDSTTSTDGAVLVQVVRYASAGTSTSRTPVALDPDDPAALCTGQVDYTVEPGTPTIVWETRATPVGGTIVLPFADGRTPKADTSGIIGVRLTAPQAQSNVRVSLGIREE